MELHPFLEKEEWISKHNMWYVVSARGEHPSMRVGQCCCHIQTAGNSEGRTSGGKLVIIGGANPSGPFNETHLLDFDEYEWDEPELSGFTARYEHASFISSSQPDQVIVFGGAQQDKNLNCVQTLNLATKTWSKVAARGTAPSSRTCRGSVSEGSKLYVFGGGQQGSEPVNDTQMHVFDADTKEWSQLPASGRTPSARHGHVMAVCGGKVYVHGGMSGNSLFDDMHEYNIETGTWKLIKCKGDVPSGRAAHGCVSHGNKIFIFGGMTQSGANDEAYVFDSRKSRWTKFNPDGPPPASRLDHAMCLVTLPCPKPASQSSRGSRNGSDPSSSSESAPSSDPARSAEAFLTSCVNAVAQQMTNAPGEGAVSGAGAAGIASDKEPTLCCVVHGGMDTQGEIFDDCLLLRLDNIF